MYRTDLAIEKENFKNSDLKKEHIGQVEIISVKDGNAKYITVNFPSVTRMADTSDLEKAIIHSLKEITEGETENVLAVGLGNTEITPDSIGPNVVSGLLATRHIMGEFAENLGIRGLKSVSAIAPNVLGKTGIEAAEIVKGVVSKVNPEKVIVIDALCAGSKERLFNTVQLTNVGISPGSGVKNSRKELSNNTLGVPVIALGVPTVVDIGSENGGEEMIVTLKDADILCQKLSEIISVSLNVFLQPEIEREVILSLV